MRPIINRPQFVLWLAFVVQLPIQLFLTIWCGGFFGGFSKSIFGLTGTWPPLVFGSVALFAIPCATVLGKRLNYSRTEYHFFDDHLEVEEGFFSRQLKSVAYRDVREVTLRRGVLQRLCGLGTIYLGTLATGSGPQFNPFGPLGFDNVSASGVSVRDLPDSEAAYAQVRERIDVAKLAIANDIRL